MAELQFWPQTQNIELDVMNNALTDWLAPLDAGQGGADGGQELPPADAAPPQPTLTHGGGGSSSQLQLQHPQPLLHLPIPPIHPMLGMAPEVVSCCCCRRAGGAPVAFEPSLGLCHGRVGTSPVRPQQLSPWPTTPEPHRR